MGTRRGDSFLFATLRNQHLSVFGEAAGASFVVENRIAKSTGVDSDAFRRHHSGIVKCC
jgi:hypothetical protein